MIMHVNFQNDGMLSHPSAPYDPVRSAGAILLWETTRA